MPEVSSRLSSRTANGARRRYASAALCGSLLSAAATAESLARGDEPAAAERARAAIERVAREAGLPSLSAAIWREREIVWAGAVGVASLEHAVDASPATVYAIGSVSKTLTATAVLRLASEGQLALDGSVRDACPALPESWGAITLRQLLAHTGGVRHYDYRRFEEDFLNTRRFATLADALTKFAADPFVAAPGERHHYSSWGYVALGCAVEGAAEAPYFDTLKRLVLAPAGMASTVLADVRAIVPHRADGYGRDDDGELVRAGLFDPSDRYPAGGLASTPTDLVRFAGALMDGRLLDPAVREAMWTPVRLASGEATPHGLGWELTPDGGAVFHGGTTVGGSALLYLRPTERIAVALATNLSLWTRGRHELAAELADLLARPAP